MDTEHIGSQLVVTNNYSEVEDRDILYLPNEVLFDNENTATNLSPVQIQQEYYENLPGCDWVKYEINDRNHLLQNVAFALFGSPTLEGDLTDLMGNQVPHLEGYTSRQKEQVMKICTKICEQSKYSQNNQDIFMSVLLIVCAKPKPLKFYQIKPKNYWIDLHEKSDGIEIWCTVVFRVRKCIPIPAGAKSCRVYIDEYGRVYKDWNSYLKNNTLPKCVLIVPQNGEYRTDIVEGQERFAVRLTVAPSPSLGLTSRVLSSADTVNTVASIGALGVIGVAMFTPVAPVVLTGAAVATITTGLYGLARSSYHLRDRKTHEQSISPMEGEARGSWMNIAASSVGLASGAASTLLAKSASAGSNMTKTGRALAASVKLLRQANIITGGAGMFNSLAHIILKYRKHGEKPTKLEIFQFTAATLFFFNACMSTRTAREIVDEAQAATITDYRASLRSNRHRKMFDKLTAESRRVQGNVEGNTEVIQGIRNIADKNQYFADVLKINKDVNAYKLRISMNKDGHVNLNSQHKFAPSELYGMGKEGRSQLFSSMGPADVVTSNVPTRFAPSTVPSYVDTQEDAHYSMLPVRPGEILRIGSFLVKVSASGAEHIADMLQNLSQEVHADLMTVALNVLSKLIPQDIARLRLFNPDEDLIVQIVKFVFDYMKQERPLGKPSPEMDNGIVLVLKEFFQDGMVRKETILLLKDRIMARLDRELDKRRSMYPNKKQITCKVCHGIRYA